MIRLMSKKTIKPKYLTEDVFEKRLREQFDEFFLRLVPIFNNFVTTQEFEERIATLATKKEFNELKDLVLRIDQKLDIKYTFIEGQVHQNTSDITVLKKKVGLT